MIIILTLTTLSACKDQKKEEETTKLEIDRVNKEDIENAIIYEANIRQYSKEGTFNEFTKDIPHLKELGIKILWIMPIQPISETKRKATGNKFVSDIKDENERKKYLGSYYSISDYRSINPNFGTKDDLRNLIKTAHELGIWVILDWVPNHTGWDHHWIKEHPDFYTKNKNGEITDPLDENGNPVGWQDVADLNYNNPEMRKAMIADMKYWITEENIDGFRCDVAGSVPTDFWEEALPQLRAEKDIFLLAEAWEPELLKGDTLFDMCYGWDQHHMMVAIAKGEKNVSDWDNLINDLNKRYEKDDIIMQFTANHDENSWNGTVKELFGDADKVMAVLSYLTPGMPLIYSGQEYDLDHRLKFFEKDQIPREKGEYYKLYSELKNLKLNNQALNGGKNAASYERLNTSNNESILAFKRAKNEDEVIFIANLSNQEQNFNIDFEGTYKIFNNGQKMPLNKGMSMSMKPWAYMILEK